ncbi:hypothetical protein GMDG_03350 [Pseudogymnoascus destructans 20631-21]|uniref:Uncharacterized protein n=1 Tax=Pseudogymnoascus destructans (strain ATCC MYA-4855 / 20631-21) TaxID=658429 RepID=L8G753_PSED2|nr:hypothetical protein GMDG_03350 [Pseudogymnoascus destructans 20631-21]
MPDSNLPTAGQSDANMDARVPGYSLSSNLINVMVERSHHGLSRRRSHRVVFSLCILQCSLPRSSLVPSARNYSSHVPAYFRPTILQLQRCCTYARRAGATATPVDAFVATAASCGVGAWRDGRLGGYRDGPGSWLLS